MRFSFDDIAEELPEEGKPFLDREECDLTKLKGFQRQWRREGVIILKRFMPLKLIQAYGVDRQRYPDPKGWPEPTPYVNVPSMRDMALYSPLMDILDQLIGAEMGLHLCLTGWVSTEREWHQDDYLNPEFVQSHYLACWFAMENIDPRSGPFEFVSGSHRWPCIRRHKLFNYLSPEDQAKPSWPSDTQEEVAQACSSEIKKRQAESHYGLLEAGDVLIWHGRLMHRGSKPMVPGTPRRALIAHYSAIDKRIDMKTWEKHRNERRYFIP